MIKIEINVLGADEARLATEAIAAILELRAKRGKEIQASLGQMSEAATPIADLAQPEVKEKPAKKSKPATVAATAEAPAPSAPTATSSPAAAAPAPSVTLEMVRAKLTHLTQKEGKSAQVVDLMGKYGAKKLTEIDEKDYAELLEKAGEL